MQDEQFSRQWNAGHDRFSADLDRGLGHLLNFFRKRAEERESIGNAYGFLDRHAVPATPGPQLSPAGRASLRGLAASVVTVALWVSVMLVATPTPGFAAPPQTAATQASECVVSPVLA